MSRKIIIDIPDWSPMEVVFNILREAMDTIGISQYSMKEATPYANGLIEEFLADLKIYKKQLGVQVHVSLNLLIEKWEKRRKE